jgi:ABC transport system ATP-binding/permease protein
VLGRDPRCDISIQDERVSWQHARIELSDGLPLLSDLGSSNGTYLDGARLGSDGRAITRESLLRLGSTGARVREIAVEPSGANAPFRRMAIRGRTLRIGRAEDNDVVLSEPNVSWHHAELRPGDPPTLVDLGSRNGVRLGNQPLAGAGALAPGIPAGIGPFSLRYEGGELVIVDERGGLSLSAQAVSARVGRITILHPTGLSVAPGEFAALIGPSGSGKTTLLKCLAGVGHPSGGRVLIGADPLELRLTEVGYVPQSDVVHDQLTVREALLYAARLRLPSDTRRVEHLAAVEDVLADLRLEDHQQTRIGRLSGGQRKRVACGVELIGKPTMLLLDEPTSGLDPALEKRLMSTLRALADSGRGIVVVTHATSSLSMCNTVAVMGPGGHMLFCGSPRESLEHFQVPAYDEIYSALDLVEVPQSTMEIVPARPPRPGRQLLSGRSLLKQTSTLLTRYVRTFAREHRTVAILLGQAPVMGLLIGLLYPGHLLAFPDLQPTRTAQFVFLLVTAAFWMGMIDSCREIVKERSIVMRELAVGVRLDAYVLTKALPLFALSVIQIALLVVVATALQPLHAGPGAYVSLATVLVLTSWSAVGIGLVVSTLARSVDQATSLIPLLLIPQLLFGGALVAYARMSVPIKAVADLMVSRWAFAAGGHIVAMNTRLAESPGGGAATGFGRIFFSQSVVVSIIILLGVTAGLLLATAAPLARQQRRLV